MSFARPARSIVAVLTCAISLGACGDSETKTVKQTTTVTVGATATETVETPPVDGCSSTDNASTIPELPAVGDVPAPVVKLREQLYQAALECDFDALGDIARANAGSFSFTFGAEKDAAAYWKSNDEQSHILDSLARVLTTPLVEKREGDLVYAWPSAYSDKPTDKEWKELVASGAYTQQQVDGFRKDSVYYGYRVGIKPDGSWSYFVAGD